MKSLAESVLSSTGSNKNRKIDVFYLLKHGFELDTSYGNQKKFIHKETGFRLIKHGDKIVLNIFKDEKLSAKKLVVSTIGDLDLVIEWFKAWKYKDSTSEKEKFKRRVIQKFERNIKIVYEKFNRKYTVQY